MSEIKGWAAFYHGHICYETVAKTSKECWNKLSDAQKKSYWDHATGGDGIAIKKIKIRTVDYFNEG